MDDDELSTAETSVTTVGLGSLSRNKSTNEASKKKEMVMLALYFHKYYGHMMLLVSQNVRFPSAKQRPEPASTNEEIFS